MSSCLCDELCVSAGLCREDGFRDRLELSHLFDSKWRQSLRWSSIQPRSGLPAWRAEPRYQTCLYKLQFICSSDWVPITQYLNLVSTSLNLWMLALKCVCFREYLICLHWWRRFSGWGWRAAAARGGSTLWPGQFPAYRQRCAQLSGGLQQGNSVFIKTSPATALFST